MLSSGVMLLGAASILIARADSFALLLVLVLAARVGASFYHPIGIGWVSSTYKGHRLDRAMGFQSGLGDLGVIAAYGTAALVGVLYAWWVPFVLWGALGIAAGVVGLGLTGNLPRPEAHPHEAPSVAALVADVRLWILPLAIGGAAYTITNGFGPVYLVDRVGLTPAQAPLVIAAWLGVGVFAALAFGSLTRRVRRYTALSISYLVIGLAGLVLGYVYWLPAVVATFLAYGVALFITYPALFSFISEATGARLQGTTFGVVFAFQLIGGAAAAYASGILADLWEVHTPFLLLAGLGLATFGLLEAKRSAYYRLRAAALTAARPPEAVKVVGDPGHSRGR
jgi:MFS family permease